MLIGRCGPHMSGSIYDSVAGVDHLGEEAAAIPTVDLTAGPATARAVAQLIQDGLVRSAHDCSDGGLLVAVAEMLIAAYRGHVPAAPSAPRAAQTVDVGSVLQSILKPELSRLSVRPAAAPTSSPQIGADLTIWDDMLEADQLAFGEAPSRYVIEIKPDDVQRVRTILRDHGAIAASIIGTLNTTGRLTWTRAAVDVPVADLTSAWLGTLDW
jgi:phosphoribosylformylglycinamidine (FGAM) synthase-like enzyme